MTLIDVPDYAPDGVVYLTHLWPAFGHARHYRGYSEYPKARLGYHAKGQGAKLLQHAVAAGCEIIVVSIVPGTRRDERRAKQRKNAPRECPVCQAMPLIAVAAYRRMLRAKKRQPVTQVSLPIWLVMATAAAGLVARPDPRAERRADDPAWFIPF